MRYNKIKKEIANIPNTESAGIVETSDNIKSTGIVETSDNIKSTGIVETSDNIIESTSIVETTETKENVQTESTIKPNNIIQDINLVDLVEFSNEIKALRKDLANFHEYADFVQDMIAEEVACYEAECYEDKENANHNQHKKSKELDESEESDESDESAESEYSDESNVCDMCLIKNRISTMTTDELQELIQTCADHILIPTWYTKEDFQMVSNIKLSDNSWKKMLDRANADNSSLFDDANELTISWFDANKSFIKHTSIKKVDSDDEEDEKDDDESKEDDEDDEEILNKLIVTQLKNCNYEELKKIAGVKSNAYTKKKLIEIIGKKNDQVAILKALKFIL